MPGDGPSGYQVLDSLLGIAPIRDMVVGQAQGSAPQGPTPSGGTHAQLVAACGYQRSGALAVLRRSIVSDVITDVNIIG